MNRFGLGDNSFDSRSYPARFLGKAEGKGRGKDYGALRESFGRSDDRETRVQFEVVGRRERRARRKKTDARDPAVSEGEREKRGRAVVLTRVLAGRGKRRKGKGKKREAS